VHSSRLIELHNAAEILPKVALLKRQGMESENTYNINFPIIDTFGCYIWKAGAPDKKQFRNIKIGN